MKYSRLSRVDDTSSSSPPSAAAAADMKFNSALVQVLIVSFTCFCGPGLYNTLTSFAGGISDPLIAYNGISIVYGTFAISGFISAGVVNLIGPKKALFVGSWGYVLFAISLYYMQSDSSNTQDNVMYSTGGTAFYYIACAVLGICAGLLWTAQGQVCMAYPTSETKGLYFSIFWIIFNLGAAFGGLISFGVNYSSDSATTSDTTYIVFIIIMSIGCCCALLLADPSTVVRPDDTLVQVQKFPDWRVEAAGTMQQFIDPKMLLLFPLFSYSNWFYTYHAFYNAQLFNPRTNGLSSACYWASQMIGAWIIGKFLDRGEYDNRQKAFASIGVLTTLISLIWGLGLWAQLEYDISYTTPLKIDFLDSSYPTKLMLYIFYGFNDAICQVWAYWLMGQFSDDMTTLGRYSGYYKAVQSGMAAVSWKIGGSRVNPAIQLIINWVLATFDIIGAYFSILWYLPTNRIDQKDADV